MTGHAGRTLDHVSTGGGEGRRGAQEHGGRVEGGTLRHAEVVPLPLQGTEYAGL